MSVTAIEVNRIPVVMSVDAHFITPLKVAVYSICENCEDRNIDLTILCAPDLGEPEKNRVYELCDHFSNLTIRFYCIEPEDFKYATTFAHFTLATFYRLAIMDIIPDDKCLYLDGDMVIRANIKELYDLDISEYYVAGARDNGFSVTPEYLLRHCEQCGIDNVSHYINAGVLVINLSRLRKAGLKEKFFEETKTPYPFVDQDILNKVCVGGIKLLDWRYDYINRYQLSEVDWELEGEWKIIHYAGRYKPWKHLRLRGADIWWEYARKALEKDVFDALLKEAERNARENDWSYYVDRCRDEERIVIIGYTSIGLDLAGSLKKCGIKGKISFADNSERKQKMGNAPFQVFSVPQMIRETEDAVWIIASQNYVGEIKQQLMENGISEGRIITYLRKPEDYYRCIEDKHLSHELEEYYYKRTGCRTNR